MLHRKIQRLNGALLLFALLPLSTLARPFVLVLSQDDLSDAAAAVSNQPSPPDDVSDFDDFPESESKSDSILDPGSWSPLFEPDLNFQDPNLSDNDEVIYYNGVRRMVEAAAKGEFRIMEEAAAEIEAAAADGHPHGQSVMGLLYSMGIGRERNEGKAFLHHHFAAQGGNMQSKMALAYTYYRQESILKGLSVFYLLCLYDLKTPMTTVKLYAELAEIAVNSFLISKDSPVIEPIRIHSGAEENKEALRKSRGEEDEDFQILEYQAQKGNAGAMYKIGIFYYFGLRGVRRDHAKALRWFSKAVEKGEPRSMELLGEIYARGAGVERNYTKALEWLTLASKQQLYSAYNGMGYLYVKGYGVEKKNYTKAKEYFEKAADNEEPGGFYNLGVMYLKGLGLKRDLKIATKYFALAANAGQPKAFYQLAKMFHTGVGLKKNLPMATALYKLVAERGPWSSLSRWALESYLKGDIGKAFLLYSRMAEIGYEVAQSNAAWILDKYGESSMCMGESGLCTDAERHQRAHALWWKASEQGNEHAALLIGDAYYYGRGTDRDYDRAAEAYMHAKSQSNAQAMFNLGYMHEHGQGLPLDLHLAKRYYDQALEVDPAAKLPVSLALASLWIRRNYANSFLVDIIDSLPEVYPEVEAWVENVIMEEGNATILTLFVCLLTVLYLRERQRRHAAAAADGGVPPVEQAAVPLGQSRLPVLELTEDKGLQNHSSAEWEGLDLWWEYFILLLLLSIQQSSKNLIQQQHTQYIPNRLGSGGQLYADFTLVTIQGGCFRSDPRRIVNNDSSSSIGNGQKGIQEHKSTRYLELPLGIRRSKKESFEFVVRAVRSKLVSWKNNMLNGAGKEVLIKAVIGALHVFSIWSFMTSPKSVGGLGFKDINLFNEALILKQLWKIVSQPNLLVRDKFKQYFKVEVRNGRSSNIWNDPWSPKVDLQHMEGGGSVTRGVQWVEELLEDGGRRWNMRLVEELFSSPVQEAILKIKTLDPLLADRWIWTLDDKGKFSVACSYHYLLEHKIRLMDIAEGSYSNVKDRKVWMKSSGLKIKNKLKHFICVIQMFCQ
ncbi:hypothetical protein STAS_01122 [Striga asiatica]|uniref:ERAD-associated E3 ubiquitin-protein ligase component HRD3A n=1 Tax=Striga asiatica TaxID=4170 RepID=A0A5A7NYP2_STRAF|nr:hypothetical protein STAS_01122 [Striga asiatica]